MALTSNNKMKRKDEIVLKISFAIVLDYHRLFSILICLQWHCHINIIQLLFSLFAIQFVLFSWYILFNRYELKYTWIAKIVNKYCFSNVCKMHLHNWISDGNSMHHHTQNNRLFSLGKVISTYMDNIVIYDSQIQLLCFSKSTNHDQQV